MNTLTFAPPPYPVEALPPFLRDVTQELQRNVQAPDAMNAMSVLAVTSMACQGLMDVKLPTGQVRPCSLNVMIVGESGERKTTIDGHLMAPIYEADRKLAVAYQKVLAEEEESHRSKKKVTKRLRRFLRENATKLAIMESLLGDGESIVIASNEGEILFRSGAMSSPGLLNKMWDGVIQLTYDRSDFDHLFVWNPRVTVFVMTQMAPLKAYVEKHGDMTRGTGHWARYLIGYPQSTKGYRLHNAREPIWMHLPTFHTRVTDLLVAYLDMVEKGQVRREVLEFTEEAKTRWFELSAQTEWLLRPGEFLHDIQDVGSKMLEIIARLAALFHFFCGQTGRISLDTLERAFCVVNWHVGEYKRLFSPQCVVPQENVDAQNLARYLRERVWRGPGTGSFIAKNHLLQYGPLRQRDRLNAALNVLITMAAVFYNVAPKTKQRFICLSDPFFSAV